MFNSAAQNRIVEQLVAVVKELEETCKCMRMLLEQNTSLLEERDVTAKQLARLQQTRLTAIEAGAINAVAIPMAG